MPKDIRIGKGELKNDYDFHILGTEICYADYYGSSRHLEEDDCSRNPNLYVPVPFHAGDIVTIDCRPVAPVSHVVILEVGDNWDCCCLQALGCRKDGRWETGAVKHADFPPGHWPIFSPLYRITTFCRQLPEEERLLETVSRYIEGNEKKGAAVDGLYQIFFPIFAILIKKISDFVVMRQDSAFPIKRVPVILHK